MQQQYTPLSNQSLQPASCLLEIHLLTHLIWRTPEHHMHNEHNTRVASQPGGHMHIQRPAGTSSPQWLLEKPAVRTSAHILPLTAETWRATTLQRTGRSPASHNTLSKACRELACHLHSKRYVRSPHSHQRRRPVPSCIRTPAVITWPAQCWAFQEGVRLIHARGTITTVTTGITKI
jgi:hypothetical protein